MRWKTAALILGKMTATTNSLRRQTLGQKGKDDNNCWYGHPICRYSYKNEEGLDTVNTADYCVGRKVVLFSVPGAFTLAQLNLCRGLLRNSTS